MFLLNSLFPSKLASESVTQSTSVDSDILIDLRQLKKAYPTPDGEFWALKGIDLQIRRGELVAIEGKSGAGKSTLINMITGIDAVTEGEVSVGGQAIHQLNEGQIAKWRGRNMGVIFQFFQLMPMLTCVENVMLPMDFCNMYGSQKARREKALELLGQVEIREQAFKKPSAISGGQQQRVAIARALANEPPVIAADEPTGNLDSKTADAVFRLFERLVNQGTTILMVTHDRELANRANRTITLVDGQIYEDRHP